MRVFRRLATCDEDDVALAGVGILVLKEKKVVNAIVAEGRGLDDDAQRPSQALFNYEVLLSANLQGAEVSSALRELAIGRETRDGATGDLRPREGRAGLYGPCP